MTKIMMMLRVMKNGEAEDEDGENVDDPKMILVMTIMAKTILALVY